MKKMYKYVVRYQKKGYATVYEFHTTATTKREAEGKFKPKEGEFVIDVSMILD